MITAAGHKPTVVFGRHAKIKWVQNGRSCMLVCSVSPSDRQTIHQSRSTLRRLLASEG
jgi:hypothetical protein